MPRKLASYLFQSQYGVWYLRYTVSGHEVRRSLRTRNPEAARLAAYQFGYLKMSSSKPFFPHLTIKTPDGTTISTDADTPEEREAANAAYAKWLAENRKPVSNPDDPEYLKAVATMARLAEVAAQSVPAAPVANSIGLQLAIDHYLEYRKGGVASRSITSFRSDLGRLVKAFGPDKPVHEISVRDIDHLFGKMQHPEPGSKPSSKATIKNVGSVWKNFWSWLEPRYGIKNVIHVPVINAKSAAKLAFGKKVRGKWSADDLRLWFSTENIEKQTRHDLLWMPIIGLYTGARLEAIGRLKLDDFREYEPGKWCIRFDPQYDKCGRERETPIHPRLIEIGLLEYLEDVRSIEFKDGHIFPALTEIDSRRTHYISKRFGELRKKLGIADGSDFHSFRSTLVSCLAKNGCNHYAKRAYVGHEEGDPSDVHEVNYTKPVFGPSGIASAVFPCLDYQKSDDFIWPGWRYQRGSAIRMIRDILSDSASRKMKKEHRKKSDSNSRNTQLT